jgi:hypothetical protein
MRLMFDLSSIKLHENGAFAGTLQRCRVTRATEIKPTRFE